MQGDADVVVVPGSGVLAIEVKSHKRVGVREDGAWLLGTDRPTFRSPHTQASDNAHSIIEWLQRQGRPAGFPIWSAVWFPAIGGEVVARLPLRIDVPEHATPQAGLLWDALERLRTEGGRPDGVAHAATRLPGG